MVLKDGEVVLHRPTREGLAQVEILSEARRPPPAVVQLSRRSGFLALTRTWSFRKGLKSDEDWWAEEAAGPVAPVHLCGLG